MTDEFHQLFVPGRSGQVKDVLLDSCGAAVGVLILMLVGVANVMDVHVVGTGSALRGAVIAFYLSNEGLSLLENAAHIGLPIPDRMKNILAQLHGREDKSNNDKNDDTKEAN